jgi:hypothetical protein
MDGFQVNLLIPAGDHGPQAAALMIEHTRIAKGPRSPRMFCGRSLLIGSSRKAVLTVRRPAEVLDRELGLFHLQGVDGTCGGR